MTCPGQGQRLNTCQLAITLEQDFHTMHLERGHYPIGSV